MAGFLAYAAGGIGGFLIGGPVGAALGLGAVKLVAGKPAPTLVPAPGSPQLPASATTVTVPTVEASIDDFIDDFGPIQSPPPPREIP